MTHFAGSEEIFMVINSFELILNDDDLEKSFQCLKKN